MTRLSLSDASSTVLSTYGPASPEMRSCAVCHHLIDEGLESVEFDLTTDQRVLRRTGTVPGLFGWEFAR
jgi:hypothetical protein